MRLARAVIRTSFINNIDEMPALGPNYPNLDEISLVINNSGGQQMLRVEWVWPPELMKQLEQLERLEPAQRIRALWALEMLHKQKLWQLEQPQRHPHHKPLDERKFQLRALLKAEYETENELFPEKQKFKNAATVEIVARAFGKDCLRLVAAELDPRHIMGELGLSCETTLTILNKVKEMKGRDAGSNELPPSQEPSS